MNKLKSLIFFLGFFGGFIILSSLNNVFFDISVAWGSPLWIFGQIIIQNIAPSWAGNIVFERLLASFCCSIQLVIFIQLAFRVVKFFLKEDKYFSTIMLATFVIIFSLSLFILNSDRMAFSIILVSLSIPLSFVADVSYQVWFLMVDYCLKGHGWSKDIDNSFVYYNNMETIFLATGIALQGVIYYLIYVKIKAHNLKVKNNAKEKITK